ncbi:uncharacterized protein LOC115438243 [Sphaeramia orbicularis]|uniref:uncharacterized protein LOC115438243 n=1 Tax=Sphaeramia orbicularis TaxID=375764 RepID=UPI00117EDE0D|nr:uncharacterized protein LOC115438243 [Sphaeramia orbicularis]
MLLFLLLLLMSCTSQASHFYGTVITYYPTDVRSDGAVTVVLRSKLNFRSCNDYTHATWQCHRGNCGNETSAVAGTVDSESTGQFCQTEVVYTRQVSTNAPFQLWLNSGNWILGIVNRIVSWRALIRVELRNRSDTGQANRSPQTTILPAVRVPSNCQRQWNLLTFDPDGDEVKCRYGDASEDECNPCTPPSVLNLSSSCTLSFGPTGSGNQGPYAVQLVMEDFPRQSITLTQTDGTKENRTTDTSISKIPVQFVLQVDPVVPSCTDGLYLPRFLPPTPDHGAQLYVLVNQTLEIRIQAEANMSTISELLFSGPHNMAENRSGPGEYTLTWSPSPSEAGQSHPVCFLVQAVLNSTKYHSDLRCIIMTVGGTPITTTMLAPTTVSFTTTETVTNSTTRPITAVTSAPAGTQNFIIALRLKTSSSSPLTEDNIQDTVLQQLKDELVRQGLPSSTTLRLLRITEP